MPCTTSKRPSPPRNRRLAGRLTAAAALALAAPAWAVALTDAPLTEAKVRAFVAQQERDWNAGALPAYYAAFRSDAVFADQYRSPDGRLTPYGQSTLAEARAQTRKFRSRSKVAEHGQIVRIALAPDGQTAEVTLRVTSRIESPQGRVRTTCADRRQTLVLTAGRPRSKGQTDTFMRCGR